MEDKTIDGVFSQVKETIDRYRMFRKTKKVVIGFSGGPDSVCALDVLKKIYGNTIIFSLVYVNHGLRPKGILKDEERLVHYYARKYECSCKIIRIVVPKTRRGLEAEARQRRYNALMKCAREISAQRIVLGHNLDDVVETFFINLVRGSGTLGLQSIPAVRLPFVRPLIGIKKSDILRYLKMCGLKFSTDLSNTDMNIRRNFIRLKIIPQLLKLNPQLHKVLQREIDILHNDERFIQEEVQKAFDKLVTKKKNGLAIDLKHLLYYNKAIGNRVIMRGIKNLKGNLSGLESKHIDAILSLNDKTSGKKIFLPGNLCAQRVYESVVICPSAGGREKKFFSPVKIDKVVEITNLRLKTSFVAKIAQVHFSENCEFFDFDELIPPFFLRNWKPGDIIEIKKGRKKIKKILNEARVPVNERSSIVLLCDQRGILWVVGICRAYRAFIDKKTRNILKVEFEYLD